MNTLACRVGFLSFASALSNRTVDFRRIFATIDIVREPSTTSAPALV